MAFQKQNIIVMPLLTGHHPQNLDWFLYLFTLIIACNCPAHALDKSNAMTPMLNSIITRTEGCDTNLSDLHGPYIRPCLSADSVLYLGARAAGGATRQSDRSRRCNPVHGWRSLPPWLMCRAARSERVYIPTLRWASRPHEEDSPSGFVSVVMVLA